jgi:glucose/arabinose dehydrogenase
MKHLISENLPSNPTLLNERSLKSLVRLIGAVVIGCTLNHCVFAQSPKESDYYRITTFETPEKAVLEAGAFNVMADGRLAVATRRGEIWMIRDPLAAKVSSENFSRFAHGLHEPLGLAERAGWLYVTQRSDVSRLRDNDGDGLADDFDIVGDGWEINGDYHEYAFGSKFDKEGNIWVALCLTGSFGSDVPFRGWCMRVTSDGQTIPTTYGLRSPGGVAFNAVGDVFYTDNQGPWNGTCGLKQLVPGRFVGHPGGNRWVKRAPGFENTAPVQPLDNSRMAIEVEKNQDLIPPAVLFPYNKMGQSASGIACDTTHGKFGPFENQLFVGDQTHSTIMRVDLEIVDGLYQGACFPFRAGFQSGVVGVELGPTGALFVGGTNRGWGSRGPKDFAIERLDWTGKVPFEIKTMRLTPSGFALSLTKPIDAKSGSDVSSYSLNTFTYIYREQYGSPEVDPTEATIKSAKVSQDGLSVVLEIDGLQVGHIHELHANGLRSADGEKLLHSEAYYTLNKRKASGR